MNSCFSVGVHDAQEVDQGIGQKIDVDRAPLLFRHRIPLPPDGFVESLVEQGKAADRCRRALAAP